MAFLTPIDIANRALQHIGQFPIGAFSDNSRQAGEINKCYDNLRLFELSRHTWAYSIRRARARAVTLTTQLWTPPTYSAATAYTVGQIVNYAGSTYAGGALYPWSLTVPTSTGDLPDISSKWSHFFGTLYTDIFDSGLVYAAGEIVVVPPLYSAGTTYNKNDMVIDASNKIWVSLLGSNVGNTPSSSPTQWTAWVLPSSGNASTTPQITFNSALAPSVFVSIINNNGPVSPATNVTTFPAASPYWTSVGGTVQQVSIMWPLNFGPANDTSTANLYPLPFGWLRPSLIALNSKQYAKPWLGAMYGPIETSEDYTYQGKFFSTSGSFQAIPTQTFGNYRDLDFVADIADVTLMPPLFCETLAVTIAQAIDEPLTQGKNAQKLAMDFKRITGEAMRVDMILQGDPVDELEEFIRVRL